MICERCGRHLDRLEGRIGDLNYCHPDDPNLPDCYTITSHEASITPKLIRGNLETFHKMLRMLADPNTTVIFRDDIEDKEIQ